MCELSPRMASLPLTSQCTRTEMRLPMVPSGTMGNLISVLVHCDVRGSEAILGDNSHIHVYENGGISTIGGVHPKTVPNNPDGTMDIDRIVEAIRDRAGALLYPTTRLICLENTHAK